MPVDPARLKDVFTQALARTDSHGRAAFLDAACAGDPTLRARVERAIVFTVEAWDINCRQHIHQCFSQRQVQPVIEQLQGRIAELEAELANLRSKHV